MVVRLNFTATGTASIPTNCDGDGNCQASRRMAFVRATLVTPIAGTPRYLDPLPGQLASDCQDPQKQRLWQVKNVVWFDRDRPCIYLPPDAPFFGAICYVNGVGVQLDLYNAMLNTTVRCNGAMIPAGSAPGTKEHPVYCEEVSTPSRKYYTQTRVLLLRDNTTSTLQVNQTWQCDQDGQDRPYVQCPSSPPTPFLCCNFCPILAFTRS